MLRGHLWTLRRHLLEIGIPAPQSEPFRVTVPDDRFGQVELGGRLDTVPGARTLAVLVHGLGGSSGSSYLREPARWCRELGISSLRLDLRGADLRGADLYHAGLSSDLHRVLSDPRLDRYERRYLWGFSLGGHVCLRYAADQPRGLVHAVAAITAPLDLDLGATLFDRHVHSVYRRHVLSSLLAMYRAFVARRGPWPVSLSAAHGLRSIRQFDDVIVAPRFGFNDASDYYVRNSASHALRRIDTPTLLVQAEHDPMVPLQSVAPLLDRLPPAVTALLVADAGHVAFPAHLDLGQPGPRGLAPQVLGWLQRNGHTP